MNSCLFGEDQSAPFLVNLNDLKGDLGADQFAEALLNSYRRPYRCVGRS